MSSNSRTECIRSTFLNLLIVEEPLKYVSSLGESLHIKAQRPECYKIMFVSCVTIYICINSIIKLKIKDRCAPIATGGQATTALDLLNLLSLPPSHHLLLLPPLCLPPQLSSLLFFHFSFLNLWFAYLPTCICVQFPPCLDLRSFGGCAQCWRLEGFCSVSAFLKQTWSPR